MKNQKKSIKKLVKETNSLFQEAKTESQSSKKSLFDSLIKCEKAYDL